MVTLATYARVILLTLAKPSGECYRLGSFHDGRDTGAGFGALVGRGGPGGRAETLSSTSASNAAAGIKLSSGASDEVASSHWGVNVQGRPARNRLSPGTIDDVFAAPSASRAVRSKNADASTGTAPDTNDDAPPT